METNPPPDRNALSELLKKLRVAQDDILQNARTDSFTLYVRRIEQDASSEPRRALYREAFEFLQKMPSFDDAALLSGLQRLLPVLSEMKRYYSDTDEECTALDYVSFVGSRIGEIPEDRFFLAHADETKATAEAARQNLELTSKLIQLALGAPDDDLKSLAIRTLLGGVSFLTAEEAGKEGDGPEAGGESEIYAAAARYDVPPPVIDRAMRLTDSLARLTADRRRKRKRA